MNISDAILLITLGLVGLTACIRTGQWIGQWLARRNHSPRKHFDPSSTNDAALTHPHEDRLGYAPFAKHLAESLMGITAPRGFVLAITGAWGTGKTSLLNFMQHYVEGVNAEGAGADVVRFNPWWFASREDLTRQFFDQLQVAASGLDIADSATVSELQRLENALATAGAPGFARSLLSLGLPRQQDIPQIKERVADRLVHRGRRIIVFIDDVDRLDADQIAEVFMLVKAVGDFPNVLYVLAFDHRVVATALDRVVAGGGDAYIEKIVQTSFDLPAADPVALRQIFVSDLNTIIASTPESLFDSSHWGNVFWDGVAPILSSPRRVVRLLNAIRVTYPPLVQEVNGVDFIGLEVIRSFSNDLYHLIRNNPEHFVGDLAAPDFPVPDDIPERDFHRSWHDQLPNELRSPLTALVSRLFPRVEAALAGRGFQASGSIDNWMRERRICHPEVFAVFFQLAVPEGAQSRAEIAALLSIIEDQTAFSAHLIQSARERTRSGTSRVRQELEGLLAYVDEIPDSAVRSVVRTFFDVGDRLLVPEDEGSDFLAFGNDIRIGRLIWTLLRRFREPTRFEYLLDAISAGRALTLATHEATTLAQQHGEFEGEARALDDRIVNEKHLNAIKAVVVQKIERAAAEGNLASAVDLGSILYRWKAWGNPENVRQWVEDLLRRNDEGLLTLINAFSGVSRSFGQGDRVARARRRLSLKSLGDFVNLDEVVASAREMAHRVDLDPAAHETLQLLLSAAEDRAAGRNPNFPFDE